MTPAGMRIGRRPLLQGLGLALTAPFSFAASNDRRIVSVGGAITETIYALGAQSALVGVDTTSIYPAAARELPSVGYARSLSAEGVLSLAPTLIVASDEAGPPAVLRQLESAKVPLHVLPAEDSVAGVVQRTQKLAALLGREAAGATLVSQLQRDAQAATDKIAAYPGKPPRALFLLSHSVSQLRVAGQKTAADAMIRLAGGTNALTGFDGYKPLNPEAAVAAAPDVLLVTDQGLAAVGGIDGLLRTPGLAATPAGRARRVASLDALWLLGFGPRLPAAMLSLAESLRSTASR